MRRTNRSFESNPLNPLGDHTPVSPRRAELSWMIRLERQSQRHGNYENYSWGRSCLVGTPLSFRGQSYAEWRSCLGIMSSAWFALHTRRQGMLHTGSFGSFSGVPCLPRAMTRVRAKRHISPVHHKANLRIAIENLQGPSPFHGSVNRRITKKARDGENNRGRTTPTFLTAPSEYSRLR